MSFTIDTIGSFYPTPVDRVKNPQPTPYQVGDMVEFLIGPAKGKYGKVVVERNGNYNDYEPYVDSESIGVAVVEREDLCPDLERAVSQLSSPESFVHTVVRWCDNPQQLKLVDRLQSRN